MIKKLKWENNPPCTTGLTSAKRKSTEIACKDNGLTSLLKHWSQFHDEAQNSQEGLEMASKNLGQYQISENTIEQLNLNEKLDSRKNHKKLENL